MNCTEHPVCALGSQRWLFVLFGEWADVAADPGVAEQGPPCPEGLWAQNPRWELVLSRCFAGRAKEGLQGPLWKQGVGNSSHACGMRGKGTANGDVLSP